MQVAGSCDQFSLLISGHMTIEATLTHTPTHLRECGLPCGGGWCHKTFSCTHARSAGYGAMHNTQTRVGQYLIKLTCCV